MNVALAGFYSRVQRPGRPAWGRPVGPPEWRRVIHVEALVLSNVGRWIPVGGDGTWVDGRGRPALMRLLGVPLHVPVLPPFPIAFLYSLIPIPVVPCERRKGGAGRHRARPKCFENFCEVLLMQNF